MTPKHLLLIDAILTLPKTSLDREMQRRVTAINAVTAYCGVKERISYCGRRPSRPAGGGVPMAVKTEKPVQSDSDTVLSQAIMSVRTDKTPQICFLCVGNPGMPISKRIKRYATVGSLSGHFQRHVTKLQTGKQIDCQICNVRGMHRMHIQSHAERYHGTVTRVGVGELCLESLKIV